MGEQGPRITAVQRRQLNEIFVGNSLHLSDFDKAEDNSDFQLKYKYNYFSFAITKERGADSYFVLPAWPTHTKPVGTNKNWEGSLKTFTNWCKAVHEEINTVTGWNGLNTSGVFRSEPSDLDKPFSDAEKQLVRDGLVFIGGQIQDVEELTEEQFKIVNKKLDELSDKVDKLSKFDWTSLITGTIQNMAAAAIIPENAATKIWQLIVNAFSGAQLRSSKYHDV